MSHDDFYARIVCGWKLGQDSFTKLIIYFKDGNIRTLYSIDWRSRYGKRDIQTGLDRLKKRIQEYGAKARTAQIYDTVSGDLLYQYKDGNQIR